LGPPFFYSCPALASREGVILNGRFRPRFQSVDATPAANPASRPIGGHLFAFGGLGSSARWRNAVKTGRFTLNEESTGFELWPE